MRKRILILPLMIGAVSLFLQGTLFPQDFSNDLLELTKIHTDLRSIRVSGFVRTGGNNDRFENIADGETKVLLDVEGASSQLWGNK